MVGIMYMGNSFNGLDTDTREYVTWALDDEPSGFYPDAYGVAYMISGEVVDSFGPFRTYEDAQRAAYEVFMESSEGLIEVTTPDGEGIGLILDHDA